MKKHTLQKVLSALLFALLAAVMLVAANFLLLDDIHSYTRVMMDELYAQAGQIDTLFLGSSHCYRSVDPAAVDAALGTHSFNAGSSQQLPDGSYYLLREAASQNELKTVYLEMFYTGYNQSAARDVPLACYLIADQMKPTSPFRYRYLWEMGGAAALADLLLPARHAIVAPSEAINVWRAKLTDGYQPGNYRYVTYPDAGEAYRGNGFVYTEGSPEYGFDTLLKVDPERPLSAFGRQYLEKTADYCAENGIRLVLFTAPLPSGYLYNTAGYQAYVEALRAFAAQRGTEYWDFSLYRDRADLGIAIDDFSDAHHLNGQGAEKFTRALCGVIAAETAGQDTARYFYDTVEQKLTDAPDDTLALALALQEKQKQKETQS